MHPVFRKEPLVVFLYTASRNVPKAGLVHPTLGPFRAHTSNMVLLFGGHACAYFVDRFSANNANNNNSNSTATKKEAPACFPGASTVQLKNGPTVPMSSLKVGDTVRVKRGASFEYSKVFLFTHRAVGVLSPFHHIFLLDGRVLRVSGGHFVYININDNNNSTMKLVPARRVKLGDYLDSSLVRRIETDVMEVGLYNPQTLSGDIVVDGVRVSTYTEVIELRAAHALLSILRCILRFRPYYSLVRTTWVR